MLSDKGLATYLQKKAEGHKIKCPLSCALEFMDSRSGGRHLSEDFKPSVSETTKRIKKELGLKKDAE